MIDFKTPSRIITCKCQYLHLYSDSEPHSSLTTAQKELWVCDFLVCNLQTYWARAKMFSVYKAHNRKE